jgi:hypothetical protein
MPTLSTRLKIASWDETTTAEFDDNSKITHAVVTLAEGAEGLTSGTSESVLYYRPDGSSSYVGVLRLTGTLDGRTGSFVLTDRGGYDGTTAASTSEIVAGSGTGELAGISGTATSTSTHADYPFMPLTLTYRFE